MVCIRYRHVREEPTRQGLRQIDICRRIESSSLSTKRYHRPRHFTIRSPRAEMLDSVQSQCSITRLRLNSELEEQLLEAEVAPP